MNDYEVDDFVQNIPAEVMTELAEWMSAQVYNFFTLKTKDNPTQTIKNVADEEDIRDIATWSSYCALSKGRTATEASNLQNVSTTSNGSLAWRYGRLR